MKLPQNITREDILKAIQKIQNEGVPNHAQSVMYDVLFDEERFPPKLIVSYANIFANGKELDRNKFEGGLGTWCFKLLENNGFEIVTKKWSFVGNLKKFLEQAQSENLKKTGYYKDYQGLKVEVSFGQGNSARIPWISFLAKDQKTSKGIYPVYLYYKKYHKLILAYGVNETYPSEKQWELGEKVQTIEDYFSLQGIVPERYGKSYIFDVYDTSVALDYDKIEKDLEQVIAEYKQLMGEKEEKQQMAIPFDIKHLEEDLKNTGLQFEVNLLKRFVISLLTKPFVILTGLSGSGKTKLAQAFAKWICEDESQMCIVPVGADWTNREALLGYPNALCKGEYVVPENGALQLLIEATKYPRRPYFLILDEMNLSHVERYFADFLSAMESGEGIPLHPKPKDWDGVPHEVKLPPNLFIIGTVNIDETTYMFSPKVLDRANVIEFRVTRAEMSKFLKEYQQVRELENRGRHMAASFVEMAKMEVAPSQKVIDLEETLLDYFDTLKTVGAEFGYRTSAEIHRFFVIAALFVEDENNEKISIMDVVIMQKLLPKLHGSQRKLVKVLEALGKLCLKTGDVKIYLNGEKDLNEQNVKYPLSLDKIIRMYKNLESNGFASYAEA